MSWFDKLFSDEDDEEVYQRKYSQRRQKLEEKERHRQSLLPENNDIYNRPKGNFRFPLHVDNPENSEDEAYASYTDTQASHAEERSQEANFQQDNRRHRRRRNFEENSNSEQSDFRSSRSSRSRYSQKQHNNANEPSHTSNKRRVQNYTSTYDTKDVYYRSGEFRAEEVPSAIFGTKKRHPLENDVIKSDGTFKKEEETQKHERIPTDPLNGARSYEKTEDKKSSDHQNDETAATSSKSKEELQHTMKETPNYSKADNTININNIYASQIVEEIRRERERKFLKRKKFKEALQQKREQEDTDSIQKAIDDMYAKQAKQYVEDSVFHENDSAAENTKQDQEDFKDPSETSIGDEAKTIVSEEEHDLNSDFDYEEINLDDVQQVQSIDDKDVEIINDDNEAQNEIKSDEFENKIDSEASSKSTEAAQPLKNEEHEITEAQYTEMDDAPAEKTEELDSKTETSSQLTEDVPVATSEYDKHLEVQEPTSINEPSLKPDNQSKEEVKTQSSLQNTEDKSVKSQEGSKSLEPELKPSYTKEAPVDKTAHPNEQKSETESLEPRLTPEQPSNNKDEAEKEEEEKQEDISDTETLEESISEDEETQNEIDTHDKQENNENEVEDKSKQSADSEIKRPLRKGAKPFNVMMTPSDKRRMQRANKNNNASTLRPDIKKESESTRENKPEQEQVQDADVEKLQGEQRNNVPENNVKQEEAGHITESMNQLRAEQNTAAEMPQTELTEQKQETSSEDNIKSTKPVAHEGIRKGPNLKLPSVELLDDPEIHEIDEEWIEEKKQELNDAFYYFNVPAEVKNVTEGPSVTRFELSVEKGVKVSRITALQDDLKMALAAKDIRIEAPIPGTSLVGIEVPNVSPTKVNLRSIIESAKFKNAESKLTVAMGNRINNEPLLMDIAKTPHALIAGATGSGKSVAINSMLLSLLYKNHPEELKLLLIDPKMVELAPYNGLPHLVSPVITDVKAATQSLKWAVDEMEKRYKLFAQYHVRNITAFNKKASYEQRLPKIVIVIDELADLMMMAPQEVEQSIARIAQKARACGIHMLVATQRPSVNVITGLIKANIPTRIAFMVSSSVDSRTILDSGGAERLLGYGDMLYLGNGMNKPIRVQGSFVSDDEIDAVVDFIKEQRQPEYLFEEKELLKQTKAQSKDDLFDEVCRFMVAEDHISTSLIQRHFQIGYNRAARIVDQLEELGYISGSNGSKPREVYLTSAEINEE
ncbi:DNA translocase FtsK [Staphylococcus carnosus]|uniref:FtsK/SpoIIIE family protein n=1 Tax=Staphylococcus carnosus (strain TM300) TaxID=396513 RepID=B9DN58_STACT|nr:DNA translocase FtsK [Staphylococcus carnosus]QPT04368.1 DNA translocase FtsK [Staphylococcus carnosus]UQA67093.1 DNA translocase FtsK [Staphylococcus carnosus]UTB78073.1 cell division protein FtsK [Staphylococcus carnosus]UTB87618.1 cell division protein FtsK [Staphylococcus carnosus]UTB89970.1 cell division protein FtsK [Staphylococcus carnosus]